MMPILSRSTIHFTLYRVLVNQRLKESKANQKMHKSIACHVQSYCSVNHISGHVSASVMPLMLRTAIYPTFTKFQICTANRNFKVHGPILLMVLFYCLSLTQLDTFPLYIAHPTFFILSLHMLSTASESHQHSKQGLAHNNARR